MTPPANPPACAVGTREYCEHTRPYLCFAQDGQSPNSIRWRWAIEGLSCEHDSNLDHLEYDRFDRGRTYRASAAPASAAIAYLSPGDCLCLKQAARHRMACRLFAVRWP